MIDLSRLQSQLMTSGLQQKDNALFQVINQLITYLRTIQVAVDNSSGSSSNNAPKNGDYLTWDNQVANLPNSRNLIAGTNISFDDTIANQRIINSENGSEWSVLTDGFNSEPELIYAGGEVIMTHIP